MADDEPIIIYRIPSWVRDLEALKPLAGLSAAAIAGLVAFAEDPTEFIIERVLGFVVAQILAGGAYLVEQVDRALAPLVGLPETLAAPILSGGGAAADAVVSVLQVLNDSLITTYAAAGPAAPFIPLVIALLTGIALSWAARALIRVIPVL